MVDVSAADNEATCQKFRASVLSVAGFATTFGLVVQALNRLFLPSFLDRPDASLTHQAKGDDESQQDRAYRHDHEP
jgi:hypothetical protein